MVCSKIDKGLMSGSNKILWRLKPIYNIEILTKPGQDGVRFCLQLRGDRMRSPEELSQETAALGQSNSQSDSNCLW